MNGRKYSTKKIRKAKQIFGTLMNIWKSAPLCTNIEIIILNSIILRMWIKGIIRNGTPRDLIFINQYLRRIWKIYWLNTISNHNFWKISRWMVHTWRKKENNWWMDTEMDVNCEKKERLANKYLEKNYGGRYEDRRNYLGRVILPLHFLWSLLLFWFITFTFCFSFQFIFATTI